MKGQITLPAAFRKKLGLESGLKVAMREVEGGILIDAPLSMAAVRERARAEMEAAGTWGSIVDAHKGWELAAGQRLGIDNG